MDVVLGVSIAATTVRMVLVEGESADGVIIETEAFDTAGPAHVPRPSPSEQVSNAILATRQNALPTGHHLVVSGVIWEDEAQHTALRDSMIARDLDDVVLLSEQSAAGALAQTIGCALGYHTTAVLLIKVDTATLSIVDSADGSIAELFTRNIGGAKLADALPEIAARLETNDPPPQGVVILGSCIEIGTVKSRLASLTGVPVIVPEEPHLGLARGAALAAAHAAGLEAPTVGLAYSKDPDGDVGRLCDSDTEVSPPLEVALDDDLDSMAAHIGHALLIPVGSFVGAICVLGVVPLVMSLTVSIGTTASDNLDLPAAENATAPSVVAPTPPPVQSPTVVHGLPSVPQAQLIQPPPPPASPEPAAVAPEPPVAAPVITPAPKPRPAPPVVPQPAPSRSIAEPKPAPAEPPADAAPGVVAAPPAAAPPVAAPFAPPPPVALPPPVAAAPFPPAPDAPPPAFPWGPPTLWIGPFHIPLGPRQPPAPPPEQLSPGPPIGAWAPQEAPPRAFWPRRQGPPPLFGGRDGGHERWLPWG
jgi:hypothetical protein